MRQLLNFICLLAPTLIVAQQLGGNSISDFVGQLTNLINQNGGIGNLASALQGASQQGGPDNNGFGVYQRPGAPPVLTGPGGPSFSGPQKPYPPNYPPSYRPGGHPGFLNALASIARYDDLKCVPRLLCEVTSGGKPGYSGSSASVVPATNKDTLIALLTVLNFIDESPLLVFGRAALIGYTARGNSRACITAYPTCPRDPDALVDYLNNHNGGFFKFFGGVPQQPYPYDQQQPYPYDPQNPYPQDPQQPYYPQEPQHTYPHDQQQQQQPYYPQGPFQGQSDYGYPPRPYKTRPYPYRTGPKYQDSAYSPDDPYSAYNYAGATQFYQERIQNHAYPILSIQGHDSPVTYQPSEYHNPQQSHSEKLVFPDSNRSGKSLTFPRDDRQQSYFSNNNNFFPDRTGTGKLLLDNQGVHYYNGPPDLINFRDQRSIKFPTLMNFPST